MVSVIGFFVSGLFFKIIDWNVALSKVVWNISHGKVSQWENSYVIKLTLASPLCTLIY